MTSTQTALLTNRQPNVRKPNTFQRHDDLLDAPVRGGDRDHWSLSSVLELLPTLPNWPDRKQFGHRARISDGARAILEWLHRHPGHGGRSAGSPPALIRAWTGSTL